MELILKLLNEYKVKKNPVKFAKNLGVVVGDNCRFIGTKKGTFGSEPYLIEIGNHVTLTKNVQFITHDGGVWVLRDDYPEIDVFGKIKIGNNVFVGINSIIMPGVTIGDNVVIGAGSVVSKSIPSNSIAVGVPAKVIKTYEQYKNQSIEAGFSTKKLSSDAKRNFLINQFK